MGMDEQRRDNVELKDQVRRIVFEIVEVDPSELTDSMSFKEAGVDSLMALDILTALEKNFKTKLPEEVLRDFTSIDNITSVFAARLQQTS